MATIEKFGAPGVFEPATYSQGIKVTNDEMASLNVKPDSFHGEWNYTIAQRRPDG